jgi:hypothetical protein
MFVSEDYLPEPFSETNTIPIPENLKYKVLLRGPKRSNAGM